MSSYHATDFLSSVNSRQTAFRSTPIVFVDRSFFITILSLKKCEMVYGKVFVFTIRKNQMKTSECFLIKYPNACIACWYTTLYQVESYSVINLSSISIKQILNK